MLDWQRAYLVGDGRLRAARRADERHARRAGAQSGGFHAHVVAHDGDLDRRHERDAPRDDGAMARAWAPSSRRRRPGSDEQQQISGCATQAYFASVSNLLRWWMRVAQAWGEYARNAAHGPAPERCGRHGARRTRRRDARAAQKNRRDLARGMRRCCSGRWKQLADQIRNVVDGCGGRARSATLGASEGVACIARSTDRRMRGRADDAAAADAQRAGVARVDRAGAVRQSVRAAGDRFRPAHRAHRRRSAEARHRRARPSPAA